MLGSEAQAVMTCFTNSCSRAMILSGVTASLSWNTIPQRIAPTMFGVPPSSLRRRDAETNKQRERGHQRSWIKWNAGTPHFHQSPQGTTDNNDAPLSDVLQIAMVLVGHEEHRPSSWSARDPTLAEMLLHDEQSWSANTSDELVWTDEDRILRVCVLRSHREQGKHNYQDPSRPNPAGRGGSDKAGTVSKEADQD